MNILVSGSLAFDRIMDFPEKFSDYILPDKIHMLNVCFLVNGLKEQFGGTAGNIAYNLALLGECPLILATAGRDFDSYEKWLCSLGLPLKGIRRIDEEFTAGAYITTDKADNQITGFNPGAMKCQCQYQVDGIDPKETLAIVAPGNVDDMLELSTAYKQRSIPYIFDPGQQIPAMSTMDLTAMIEGSKLFISNDYELEMVLRLTGTSKNHLLKKTGAVVTTLGDKGSIVATEKEEITVPVARAQGVLDPTGAGDAFRAGFIKGLVLGRNLTDAARMGAVSASFSVQCQGTQCHSFTIEEFWARYEENFGQGCSD